MAKHERIPRLEDGIVQRRMPEQRVDLVDLRCASVIPRRLPVISCRCSTWFRTAASSRATSHLLECFRASLGYIMLGERVL